MTYGYDCWPGPQRRTWAFSPAFALDDANLRLAFINYYLITRLYYVLGSAQVFNL